MKKKFTTINSWLSGTKIFQCSFVQCYTIIMIIIKNSTFVSPIYTFSQAGNIIVYTPSQDTNREKYFNHINYKDKRCRLRQEINTFPSISSLRGSAFSIFHLKMNEPDPSQMDIKLLNSAPTQEILLQTEDQMFTHSGKVLKNSSD